MKTTYHARIIIFIIDCSASINTSCSYNEATLEYVFDRRDECISACIALLSVAHVRPAYIE